MSDGHEQPGSSPALANRPFVFTRRHAWAIVAVAMAVAALSGGTYYLWLITPPPMPMSVPETIMLIQSPRFKRLPEDRRASYLEHSRTLWEKLPADERRKLGSTFRDDPQVREALRSAMADQMMSQARQFTMGTDMQRRQMLDKVIGMQEFGRARWEKIRAERQKTAAAAPPPDPQAEAQRQAKRQQEREEGKKWVQDKVERGDPQRQAYVSEFFKALRLRRIELGLPPDPAPPH